MNRFLLSTCLVTGTLLATGCASKKYVRNTVAPVQSKVDQVGQQTTQNTKAIEDTRSQLNQVDEHAQSGISAAKERALAADGHAATADQHAGEAMSRANQAFESADQANRELSNLENYKVQSSMSVLFKFNRSTLTSEGKQRLDQLVAETKSDKRFLITVEGFTDSAGSRAYNLALSRRRADTVVRYLVSQCGIPIYRVHMIGLGEDNPIVTAHTAAARAQNRRVEVKLLSSDGIVASAAVNAESGSSAVPSMTSEQ